LVGFVWFVVVAFGLVWPAGTIGIEFATGMCAAELFDPIPSWAHFALLIAVPGATAYGILAIHSSWSPARMRRADYLCGLALGVASVYTLLFLPLMPIAVMAILAAGLGLLPLAPAASLIGLLTLSSRLGKSHAGRLPGGWIRVLTGFGVGLVTLILLEVPGVITRSALELATAGNPEMEAEGIAKLRRYVSERELAGLLVGDSADGPGFLLNPSNRDVLRGLGWQQRAALFYRVTGKERSSVAPGGSLLRFRKNRRRSNWDFDEPLQDFALRGSDVIGPVQNKLTLADSRLDGIIDPVAATAYLEWVFTFANRERFDALEARTLIQLPEDAFISRLTLWIDGEEREAAFAGRAKANRAYQDVAIVRRRDPALVTTQGEDKVLLRCFPVPAGGEMKVRIGITAPLAFSEEGADLAQLELPYLLARNFQEGAEQGLWIESPRALNDPDGALRVDDAQEGQITLRGGLDVDDPHSIECHQQATGASCWVQDYVDEESFVVQEVVHEAVTPPTRVVVVVDCSASMRGRRDTLEQILRAFDGSLQLAVFITEEGPAPVSLERDAALEALDDHEFVGGINNVPALEAAWDLAYETPGSVVLWLRGAQAPQLGGIDGFLQRYERGVDGPPILGLPLVRGEHRTAAQMSQELEIDYRGLSPEDPVEFASHMHEPRDRQVRRFRTVSAAPADARECSSQLVRLWAHDQVLSRGLQASEAMQALASTYRLVTPLSGAVVLETERQYKRNDLDPTASPRSVPSIPEPGEWALIFLALGLLWWFGMRSKPAARHVA